MKEVADRIAVGAMETEHTQIWFSNLLYNGLFRYDYEKNELKYFGMFPEERSGQLFMHRSAMAYDSKIAFFPDRGSHIHVVDKDSKDIETIPFELHDVQTTCKITEAFRYKNQIFLLPGNLKNGFFLFKPEASRVEALPLDWESLEILHHYEPEVMFWRACLYEDSVYAPLHNTNYIVRINLQNLAVDLLDTKIPGLFGIERFYDKIWLLPERGNQIFSMDFDTNCVKSYLFDEECSEKRVFNDIGAFDGGIVLLPANGTSVYYMKEDRIKRILDTRSMKLSDNDIMPVSFHRYVKDQKKLMLLPCKFSQSIKFDQDGVITVQPPLLLEEKIKEKRTVCILDDALNVGVTIGEEKYFTLHHFIKKISENTEGDHEDRIKHDSETEKTVGQILYDLCR